MSPFGSFFVVGFRGGSLSNSDISATSRVYCFPAIVYVCDHHDTIEELRILPALLSRLVVVSEDGPLRDTLPYARFIVWARYDDLIERTAELLRDYDRWHTRIFGDPELPRVLDALDAANHAAIDATLAGWANASH